MDDVLDAVIPTSGAIVAVFSMILQHCDEMKDGQETCKRLLNRPNEVFLELVKMGKKDKPPSSDALDKKKLGS